MTGSFIDWLITVGRRGTAAVLAVLVAGFIAGPTALAQAGAAPAGTAAPPASTAPTPAAGSRPAAVSPPSAGAPTRYLPSRFGGRAGLYYKTVWGVDSLSVKWAESGELIRFAWRVVDPDRARVLSDKKAEPALEDPQAGVSLVVPAMENIGLLRQSAPPQVGKSYWMAFSNKGRLVKRGDRVNVVIGPFRADNLVVD